MRVTNFIGMPKRIRDVWPWIVAIDAFDYCAPDKLADLIASEPIPEELRPVIAKIIKGDRKPNQRKAAKLKLPADERLEIAGGVSIALGLIDVFKYETIDSRIPGKGVSVLAERKCREPEELMRELEAKARKIIKESADQLGVSVETVENALREFRKKVDNYPNV